MVKLDRRATWMLMGVLGLTAAAGFAQGLDQALRAPRPEQAAAGVDPSRDPIPNAKAVSGPALDEARVRTIAREEVSAALGASRKKAAPAPKADDDDAADEAAKPAAPVTSAPPPTTPALTPAPTPSLPPG